MKVTIIGGGSYQWAPTFIADLLLTPAFAETGGHVVLEDIDPAPLETMAALARRNGQPELASALATGWINP